jgi:hypothetical protein
MPPFHAAAAISLPADFSPLLMLMPLSLSSLLR